MTTGVRAIGSVYLLAWGVWAAAPGGSPASGDDILAKAAETTAHRRAALREYRGARHYTVTNHRFGKEASALVHVSYSEGQGAHLQRVATAGSEQMTRIIDRILGSEEELSRSPEKAGAADVSPANYSARLLGTESVEGAECYVLALTPRTRSKQLIEGKAWIETAGYALVRIEGRFAASVSALLGRPHFVQEFAEVAGYWLPTHARATSSTFLLGVSEVDVVYLEYQVGSERYQPSHTYAENVRAISNPTRR